MFALPPGEIGDSVDGTSNEKPIVLYGVTVKDFEALLKVLFNPYVQSFLFQVLLLELF